MLDPSTTDSSSSAATVVLPLPQAVHAVSLKLPPFWPNDPVVWFAQVEAQFLTHGITSQSTQFSYVIASLQPEIAQEIRDLLISPPTETPYDVLKATLIRRTSASEQKRLHQLLIAEELGDRMPSLLRHHVILHGKHATLISSPSLLLTFDMFKAKTTQSLMPFHAWISMHLLLPHFLSIIHSSHKPNRMIQISLSSVQHPCTSKLCHYHFPPAPFSAI